MTVYRVTNLSKENTSFDDKTLTAAQPSVVVAKLTDDLLQAFHTGRVSIHPPPPIKPEGRVTIDPCQFPLPVKLVGGFQGLYTPSRIKELAVNIITDVGPQMLLAADDARINFRFRNIGTNPVAVGGALVAFATAVHILAPGAIFNENSAPNVAWYAISDIGLPSTLAGFTIQT